MHWELSQYSLLIFCLRVLYATMYSSLLIFAVRQESATKTNTVLRKEFLTHFLPYSGEKGETTHIERSAKIFLLLQLFRTAISVMSSCLWAIHSTLSVTTCVSLISSPAAAAAAGSLSFKPDNAQVLELIIPIPFKCNWHQLQFTFLQNPFGISAISNASERYLRPSWLRDLA